MIPLITEIANKTYGPEYEKLRGTLDLYPVQKYV